LDNWVTISSGVCEKDVFHALIIAGEHGVETGSGEVLTLCCENSGRLASDIKEVNKENPKKREKFY